jgi:hypothetical protein
MNELIIANAAINLVTLLLPKIDEAVKNGQVSVEAQRELRAKYNTLRAAGDAAFTGPEWEIKP